MGSELFFQDLNYLEPKCPKCQNKIKYGVTTTFDKKLQSHTCNNCQTKIE